MKGISYTRTAVKLYFEVESQKLTLRGQSKPEHIKMMEFN